MVRSNGLTQLAGTEWRRPSHLDAPGATIPASAPAPLARQSGLGARGRAREQRNGRRQLQHAAAGLLAAQMCWQDACGAEGAAETMSGAQHPASRVAIRCTKLQQGASQRGRRIWAEIFVPETRCPPSRVPKSASNVTNAKV